jgi:chromate reductase
VIGTALTVYQNKPAVFLATSPDAGGGASVLGSAKGSAHYFGVNLQNAVSVPRFYDLLDAETQSISDPIILE